MNTKLMMSLSAVTLAVIGLGLTFFPNEIAVQFGVNTTKGFKVILQLLGALYYSFAMLNWMAKGSIIGGIYNRPIAIANLTHFMIGGLALTKALMSTQGLPYIIWVLEGIYILFALVFALMFFRDPIGDKNG
jgi:hypothetical protein